MRRALAAFALVVLVLAMPLAGGRVVAEGRSPWQAGQPGNPQMYCAVVFDDWGTQECRIMGSVRDVEVVRVRILGAAKVSVLVVDEVGDNPERLPEQRAFVECVSSCNHWIAGAPYTDDPWRIVVRATSPGGAFVSVSLETLLRVDERLGPF